MQPKKTTLERDQSISVDQTVRFSFVVLESSSSSRWMDNDCLRVSLAVCVSWMCDASQRPGENVGLASEHRMHLSLSVST